MSVMGATLRTNSVHTLYPGARRRPTERSGKHGALGAGVDGCKGGWIVALRNLDAPGRITVGVEPDIGAVLRRPEEPRVAAIDMQIGLPRRVGQGGRRAE